MLSERIKYMIESCWLTIIDRREHMFDPLADQVEHYLKLPLNSFWSGDGSHIGIVYDRIDLKEEAAKYSTYGVEQGKINHGNAFLSHIGTFKKMLETDYSNFLLMEEDIFFIPDRWNRIFNHKDS